MNEEQNMKAFVGKKELLGLAKRGSFMITDERQLDIIIEDPNKPLVVEDADMGFSTEYSPLYKDRDSLVDKVRKAKENGAELFEVSYDFFYGGKVRTLFPDSEKTIQAYKVIYDVVNSYGMGFSASVINPLDLGGGYVKTHEEVGYSYQYQEGAVHKDGSYSVELELQVQWMNNKGPVFLELDHVLVFAFREKQIGDSNYFVVKPEEILNISESAVYVKEDEVSVTQRGYGCGHLNIHGTWEDRKEGYNRCLAVAVYRTQEMDYFAPYALDYITGVIDKHAEAGIVYRGFYSDEMHIQFDWGLDSHFGFNEVPTRYLTPNMAKEYAKRYGEKFADFAKYLVYFSYHQHDFLTNAEGEAASQHVMGETPEEIYQTWLLRKRYFDLLNEKVVSLSIGAKEYAEKLFGHDIWCRGHATWVEAPALDRNYPGACYGKRHDPQYSHYDYHKDFYYSSSVIEALAACYNYFTWNDYFTGGGTDHGEDGYSDRNYYTQAFGISLADLNKNHYGYAHAWGEPDEVVRRFNAVGNTYGTGPARDDFGDRIVQGIDGRLTDVLAIYPLDLVDVEERFGTWMVQYGYCNYMTEDKFLEYASLDENGKLVVNHREYKAIVFLFEPFVHDRTLEILEKFLNHGGKVLWMSMPPVINLEGKGIEKWNELFGIKKMEAACCGLKAEGKKVQFISDVETEEMEILSELLPDLVYPFEAEDDVNIIAAIDGQPAAAAKAYPMGGTAVYAGFRVRDDQSESTGKDVSTLFDLLKYMGAYSPDGGEIISRPAEARYVINRFANGAVSMANHYRTFYEDYDGIHSRDPKKDAEYLAGRVLPPIEIELNGKVIFGHSVTYSGTDALTWRVDEQGNLAGFAGRNSTGITVDGQEYHFTSKPGRLAFTVFENGFLPEVKSDGILMKFDQEDVVSIPNLLGRTELKAYCYSNGIYSQEEEAALDVDNAEIRVTVTEASKESWIVIV